MSFYALVHQILADVGTKCVAHIHVFNLGGVDLLKSLTRCEAFSTERKACGAKLSEHELQDPVVALRGLIAAVSTMHCSSRIR